MEKRDAERLSLLRSGHELALVKATRDVKRSQLEDSQSAESALQRARDMAVARHNYYSSRTPRIEGEQSQLEDLRTAKGRLAKATTLEAAAAVAFLIPQMIIGFGPPSTETGGRQFGQAAEAAGRVYSAWAGVASASASASGTEAGYERRDDDWAFQADLAAKEREQVDQQIVGAQIRVAMAERDLANHDLQIRQASEVDRRMRSKFTNAELYSWMVAQLSQVYFQSYRLALDLSRRAEMCFSYELGRQDDDPAFIEPVYWDSMKKGLLAAEKLRFDLKRMESAHLEKSTREYEITKHISLMMLDPIALVRLKQTGECFVRIDEGLFDSDYPGHYMRRIKTASLSIPCMTGPYTSVNCTLTLVKNTVRMRADSSALALRDDLGAVHSIATSSAQSDSGMFELLFRDERYLPFEGAGAISSWQISLPKESNLFDFGTISDVIIHLKYTAREGGASLKKSALKAVLKKRTSTPAIRLFSAKLEFPDAWYRFLHPEDTAVKQTLELELNSDRFPFQYRGMKLPVDAVTIFLKLQEGSDFEKQLGFGFNSGTGPKSHPLDLDPAIHMPKATVPGTGVIIPNDKTGGGRWIIEFAEHMLYTPPSSKTPPVPGTPVDIGIANLTSSLKKSVIVGSVEHFRLNTDVLEDLWIAVKFKASA